MEYRKIEQTELSVSRLCLGTMMFGGQTARADALMIIEQAHDAGVNFIDTADVYAAGASEEIVGEAVRARRDHWVIATKVGAGGHADGRLSRRAINDGIEGSLKRLGLDHVHLYYLHKQDHQTPLEETVAAIGALIAAGKIRHFGVSNHSAWRIAEIVRLCDAQGIARPVASQPLYNAMTRIAEVEQLPAAAHYGMANFVYSPLARGVLTGKYLPDAAPQAGSRAARQDRRLLQTEWRRESLDIAQLIRQRAESRGTDATAFALAWALANALVTGVIAGPRTLEQWLGYPGAMAVSLTAEDEAFMDALVPPGHASTPGFTDPDSPVEGRVIPSTD